MITLSHLFVHPVKSMRGIRLSQALVEESGLAFDRNFMITEPDGTFITARQYPEMVLFSPLLTPDGLFISAPDGSTATVRFSDFAAAGAPTEVWGNHFTALIAPEVINQWLSGFFARDVQLRWVGQEMTRRVTRFPEIPLGFADGYPFLLINQASLQALRQRCPAGISISQFRPNLVVTGSTAWDEDEWESLQIGDVIFDAPKPCSRCILTTVSPEQGRKNLQGEPLATLQTFRTAEDGSGDIDFGINLVARNSGILREGDKLHILTRKTARRYQENSREVTQRPEAIPETKKAVILNWLGRAFIGDNQTPILEQLEKQGYRIPYSCRAGVCGKCRINLIAGEVQALTSTASNDEGHILSCSCLPLSDVTLTP
ncbi:MAG: putative protein YcbX [Candidatus Erwinia impunctatus]|nr:putative protein YcbX [Culicoides impunctatus]